jgi:predicted nucleic acid-binding protein
MRRGHRVLSADEEVAVTYGHIARELRASGSLIGVNDLWIAATSLHHALPLVTSNVDHFTRVSGLEIIEYR